MIALLLARTGAAQGQQQPAGRDAPRLQAHDQGQTSRPDGERPQRPRRERRTPDEEMPADIDDDADPDRSGGGRAEDRFGVLPFRPAKIDFGPLRPGEEQELMQFAEAEVPEAFVRLDRLRRNDPPAFRQRLRDMAPRLRLLRRVFQRNEALGRVLVEHIDATLAIERLVRMYRVREGNDVRGPRAAARERQEFERRLRERVQKRFEIEERAMDLHVTELVNTRDARIQKRIEALTDPAADLTDERPEVKALAEKHRSAGDPAERDAIRAQLLDGLTRQINGEIAHMRERLGRSRDNREQRAERFMRELLKRGRNKP